MTTNVAPFSGWGILALPDDSFVTVGTLEKLIGGKPRTILPPSKFCSQRMADIEPCIRAIPENPCPEIDPDFDRTHHLHMILPGQNALHAIANLLGNGVAIPSDEATSDDLSFNEDVNGEVLPEEEGHDDDEDDDEDEDDEDEDEEEEDEDGAEDDGGAHVGFEEDDEMDDESDVSWAGDEFIQEAVVNAVLIEASTQTELDQPGSSQTGNTHSWPSAPSNLLSSPNPISVFNGIVGRRALAEQTHAKVTASWDEMQEDMVYFPHSGQVAPIPQETRQLARFLKRPRDASDSLRTSLKSIPTGYHLLRTYEKEFELRTLHANDLDDEKEIGIHCANALTFGRFHDRNLRPYFRATSRLNMVMHVPELSLVIIGSPTGRVLLLTPTRLPSPQIADSGYWSHGLRVEWVLPRASDDICHGQHRRPLHGVAIGPVQDESGVGGQGRVDASLPRRYRLMLHYRNHDIATFEITRQEQTGKLCIF